MYLNFTSMTRTIVHYTFLKDYLYDSTSCLYKLIFKAQRKLLIICNFYKNEKQNCTNKLKYNDVKLKYAFFRTRICFHNLFQST